MVKMKKDMKNTKIYILSILLAAMGMVACDENLDVDPTKELENEYFVNETRMQTGVIGVYAKLTDLYTYNNNN